MYESLAFCVYAQKRRGARTHTPWGISESGFFAFDPGMTYQYKAHGVQALGLKRGLDQELVVAPYASFLALPMAPKSAGATCAGCAPWGWRGGSASMRRPTSPPPACRGAAALRSSDPIWPTTWA